MFAASFTNLISTETWFSCPVLARTGMITPRSSPINQFCTNLTLLVFGLYWNFKQLGVKVGGLRYTLRMYLQEYQMHLSMSQHVKDLHQVLGETDTIKRPVHTICSDCVTANSCNYRFQTPQSQHLQVATTLAVMIHETADSVFQLFVQDCSPLRPQILHRSPLRRSYRGPLKITRVTTSRTWLPPNQSTILDITLDHVPWR